MSADFATRARHFHAEYVRRNASHPEPLEQPRHGLRRAIGHRLIHIGERLARIEHGQNLRKAA